jgi:hypothetical protein
MTATPPANPAVEPIEIWRSAKLLIDHHGDSAALHALSRASAFKISGDEVGAAVWFRIFDAIEELCRTQRNEGEAVQ